MDDMILEYDMIIQCSTLQRIIQHVSVGDDYSQSTDEYGIVKSSSTVTNPTFNVNEVA